MIKQITFSPTGGTKKVADAIASGIIRKYGAHKYATKTIFRTLSGKLDK